MKLGLSRPATQPRNARGRFVSRGFVSCTGHGRARTMLAASAVAFILAAFSAIAHADPTNGPQAPIATFVASAHHAPAQLPASVSYVQRCNVTRSGDLDCTTPAVPLQVKADRSAK